MGTRDSSVHHATNTSSKQTTEIQLAGMMLPGSSGQLPAQSPHRPVRAQVTHTVLQIVVLLSIRDLRNVPKLTCNMLFAIVSFTHPWVPLYPLRFPPTTLRSDAPLPSAGFHQVRFPYFLGTVKALRLLVAPLALFRFLHLAIPFTAYVQILRSLGFQDASTSGQGFLSPVTLYPA